VVRTYSSEELGAILIGVIDASDMSFVSIVPSLILFEVTELFSSIVFVIPSFATLIVPVVVIGPPVNPLPVLT